MNIGVPAVLNAHRLTLKQFIDGMIFKLAVNAHKDALVAKDVPFLIDKMLDELKEFKDELHDDGNIGTNALHETFDGANFWYLIFQHLRNSGVPDTQERFLLEYFRADIDAGKIFAARNRSGSRYREGDEIAGSFRNGRCYIRIQHALTGASISMPRDHLIWWFATGDWPVDLEHKDGYPNNDSFCNLERKEEKGTGDTKWPFVVQWKPRGKEGHTHYGKYCYQRRHNGVLIKVGYWDTPDEAVREGLPEWKARTKQMEDASV